MSYYDSDFAGRESFTPSSYNNNSRGVPPPPQVPFPWRAIWDSSSGRYMFENGETGQRTFDFPQQYQGGGGGRGGYGGGGGGGYQGQEQGGYGGGGGYGQQGGGYGEERGYGGEQARPQKKHHYGEMALAGAAGLAGGALLMHEGEKIHDDYDYDKDRIESGIDNAGRWTENKFDNGVQDVEDFPDNAARWTGNQVQRVEDIPDDIRYRVDDDMRRVEDVPDDVAGWAGRKVGDVERFDDGVQDNYDQGRDDRRYGDDNRRYDDDDNRNDRW